MSNLTDVDPAQTMKLIADAYPVAYQTLYEAKPITCSVTNTTFEAVPAPCAVILDVSLPMYYYGNTVTSSLLLFYLYFQFFSLSQLQVTRAVSGISVPVIAFGAGGAGAFIRHFGPESMGGAGDIGAKIVAEVARTGMTADDIGIKVYLVSFLGGPK